MPLQMESFMTSVSPLKRLKAMISHKMGDDGNKLEVSVTIFSGCWSMPAGAL